MTSTPTPEEYAAYRAGFAAGYERAAGELTPDPTFLAAIIRLTHPDRHPDREGDANTVTARLLELRRRAVTAAERTAGRADPDSTG